MFPADEPIRNYLKQLAKVCDEPRSVLSWGFRGREFNILPVFSDFTENFEEILQGIFSLQITRAQVSVDILLPDEDRVFGRVIYRVVCQLGCDACFNVGASDSVEPAEALADISRKFEGKFHFSSMITRSEVAVDIDAPVTDAELHAELEPVDFQELEAKIGDEEMRRSLISIYLENAPKRMVEWRQAMDAGNISDAHRIIHSIKGSALNISAHRVAKLARRLEMQLKINHTEEAEELGEKIGNELSIAIESLKAYGGL
jgi:HPt (histidine-containing phosphotransfer) domain-containing protein